MKTYAERVLQTPKTPRSKPHFSIEKKSPGIKPSIPSSPIRSSSPYRNSIPLSSPLRISGPSSPFFKPLVRKDLPSKPYLSIELPGIPSNFYQNPIDWSKKNMISIVTDKIPSIYSVDQTGIFSLPAPYDECLSMKFNLDGDYINIGTNDGYFYITNIETNDIVYRKRNCLSAINSIDQSVDKIVCSQNDGMVSVFDIRDNAMRIAYVESHDGYGISSKISPDGSKFISTSEDKAVKIYDFRNLEKVYLNYGASESSVRAVEWSPNVSNVAALGGGTGDRTIRIFNIDTGETLQSVKIGAQICNIFWNKDYNEIVATHGFSDYNITLWRGSDLKHITTYHVNHDRVLFAALSDDKSKLVTATPADPMMFWLMFPNSEKKSSVKSQNIR